MNERNVSICAPLSSRRRVWNGAMRFLLYAAAAIICALLVFLIGYILYRGIPNLSWQFLSSEESIINDIQGILPAIVNTIYVIVATLIFILPLGVGSAIYLTEYADYKNALHDALHGVLCPAPGVYALNGLLRGENAPRAPAVRPFGPGRAVHTALSFLYRFVHAAFPFPGWI